MPRSRRVHLKSTYHSLHTGAFTGRQQACVEAGIRVSRHTASACVARWERITDHVSLSPDYQIRSQGRVVARRELLPPAQSVRLRRNFYRQAQPSTDHSDRRLPGMQHATTPCSRVVEKPDRARSATISSSARTGPVCLSLRMLLDRCSRSPEKAPEWLRCHLLFTRLQQF